MSEKLESWTVGDLINVLQRFDEDDLVVFEQPTHNYWRQVLGQSICEVEYAEVKYSEYNSAFQVVDEDDEDNDDVKVSVILIS